mmetsp:Transcript_19383/g.29740  ORF Transcript_19383/g.29740 Transcript_19383/m.29740 type:complete len:82 (-) Transcript_19383:65-310(-)
MNSYYGKIPKAEAHDRNPSASITGSDGMLSFNPSALKKAGIHINSQVGNQNFGSGVAATRESEGVNHLSFRGQMLEDVHEE